MISIEFVIISDTAVNIIEVTVTLNSGLSIDTEFSYKANIKFNEDHCKVINNSLTKYLNVISYQNKIMTIKYENKLFSILNYDDERIFSLTVDSDILFIKRDETETHSFICIITETYVSY